MILTISFAFASANVLDKEKNDAATGVLLKLLKDRNQDVWESAERSLEARNKLPKGLPLPPVVGS